MSRDTDAFKKWAGDIPWMPSELPADFRFLGVVAGGPSHGPYHRRIAFVAPERREIFVADIAKLGRSGAKVIVSGKPADYRCVYEEPDGMPGAVPLSTFKGITHYCRATRGVSEDVLLEWFFINTPEEEARRILYSPPVQWE